MMMQAIKKTSCVLVRSVYIWLIASLSACDDNVTELAEAEDTQSTLDTQSIPDTSEPTDTREILDIPEIPDTHESSDTSTTPDSQDIAEPPACPNLYAPITKSLGPFASPTSETATRHPIQTASIDDSTAALWRATTDTLQLQHIKPGGDTPNTASITIPPDTTTYKLIHTTTALFVLWSARDPDSSDTESLWMQRFDILMFEAIDPVPIQLYNTVDRLQSWDAAITDASTFPATLHLVLTKTLAQGALTVQAEHLTFSASGSPMSTTDITVFFNLPFEWVEIPRLSLAVGPDHQLGMVWESVVDSYGVLSFLILDKFVEPINLNTFGLQHSGYPASELTLRWSESTQQYFLLIGDTANRLSSIYLTRWSPTAQEGSTTSVQPGAGIFAAMNPSMIESGDHRYVVWSDYRDHAKDAGDYYAPRELYLAPLDAISGGTIYPLTQHFYPSPPDHRIGDPSTNQDAASPILLTVDSTTTSPTMGLLYIEEGQVVYLEGMFLCAPLREDFGVGSD
jgi:hypothetical protein